MGLFRNIDNHTTLGGTSLGCHYYNSIRNLASDSNTFKSGETKPINQITTHAFLIIIYTLIPFCLMGLEV